MLETIRAGLADDTVVAVCCDIDDWELPRPDAGRAGHRGLPLQEDRLYPAPAEHPGIPTEGTLPWSDPSAFVKVGAANADYCQRLELLRDEDPYEPVEFARVLLELERHPLRPISDLLALDLVDFAVCGVLSIRPIGERLRERSGRAVSQRATPRTRPAVRDWSEALRGCLECVGRRGTCRLHDGLCRTPGLEGTAQLWLLQRPASPYVRHYASGSDRVLVLSCAQCSFPCGAHQSRAWT